MTSHSSRIGSYFLSAIALAAAAWSAVLTFAGGLTIQSPWGRISSRDPVRPLAFALTAGVLFVLVRRSEGVVDGRADTASWPRRLALIIAAVTLAAGIRFGTFTAGGSDPSGYVSEASLWREGNLIRPAPSWVEGAPWPDAERTAAPLGYIPGTAPRTQVPSYPAGLPLLMAVAHMVAGMDGEYYVVPFAGALLVWSTFLLGARIAGPWGGVVAAALMASSPPFVMWLVMPMTDVPVAAFWTVALVCALAGTMAGAIGAGAATALAILTRPNLVPLAVVVALVIVTRHRAGMPGLIAFALVSGTGALTVAAINFTLYGSALRSGYGDLQALYALAYAWPNTLQYGSWFVATQTAIPLIGWLAPFSRPSRDLGRTLIAAIVVVFPVMVVCLYLPYKPFDEWSYLRFLLPAYPALFAGFALILFESARRWNRSAWIPPALALLVVLLVVRGLDYSNAASDLATSEPRYRRVAAAASDARPNAIFLSFEHSGSLRYYTGRDILRWDLMDTPGIDRAIGYLESRGYRLYWIGETIEWETISRRFAGSRFLDRVKTARTQLIDGVRLVDLGPP